MEERKCEELNMDCLVNVLGRLGMESLLFDVPFVCKSRYKATLNPLCWQHLDFPKTSNSFKSRLLDEYRSKGFKATELIKLAIDRSGGSAVSLVVPMYFTDEAFVCLAERLVVEAVLPPLEGGMNLFAMDIGCPALKFLTLPLVASNESPFFSRFISKWKSISGGYIEKDESLLIVTLLPNIKCLDLRQTYLNREALVRILKCCRNLVYFDVRDCEGFEGDEEILKLASHIPNFIYGSRVPEEGLICTFSGVPDDGWSEDESDDESGDGFTIHPGGNGE
ncbi:F-box/LRR-repeat protein At3g48880-like [Cornus florida]|uniref:F-box/LRR-repeat protein At3g48880-like n=1 Tax=Cornus florida TaxID=4283 RepID=UPI002899CED0|nr:F-box/LRR-repeat protein At3g48880-like [Cornus florida]